MVSKTNEQALKATIERKLTGTCREDIQDQVEWTQVGDQIISNIISTDSASHGYEIGLTSDFNKVSAIDEKFFWRFLEQTQNEELEKLKRGDFDWQRRCWSGLTGWLKSMVFYICSRRDKAVMPRT